MDSAVKSIQPRELPVSVRKAIRETGDGIIEAQLISKKHAEALRNHLEQFATKVHSIGINSALSSEEKAWHRVTVLEDVITEIARHAPGTTMAKAKALAAEVEASFKEPAEIT